MRHWLKRLYFYVSWPGLVVYFARSERARIVLTDERGSVLLVQGLGKLWYDDDAWELSGGGVRKGEKPEQTIIRELEEELGIHLQPQDIIPLGAQAVRNFYLRYQAHFYAATIPSESVLVPKRNEIANFRWVTADDIPVLVLKDDATVGLRLLAEHR